MKKKRNWNIAAACRCEASCGIPASWRLLVKLVQLWGSQLGEVAARGLAGPPSTCVGVDAVLVG